MDAAGKRKERCKAAPTRLPESRRAGAATGAPSFSDGNSNSNSNGNGNSNHARLHSNRLLLPRLLFILPPTCSCDKCCLCSESTLSSSFAFSGLLRFVTSSRDCSESTDQMQTPEAARNKLSLGPAGAAFTTCDPRSRALLLHKHGSLYGPDCERYGQLVAA